VGRVVVARALALWLMPAWVGLAACRPVEPPPADEQDGVPLPVPAPAPADAVLGPAFHALTLEGRLLPEHPLADWMPACPGWSAPGASFVLDVPEAVGVTVRVRPVGAGMLDLSMALIPEPAGPGAVCADDSATLDPVWSGLLAPGRWRLRVASDVRDPSTFAVDLLPGLAALPDAEARVGHHPFPPPRTEGDAPQRLQQGTFGGLRVGPSHRADALDGMAGGPRRAADLGPPCVGWIAEAPDHVIEVLDATDLTVAVQSVGDTTLVLQGPDGQRLCADDGIGLQPALRAPFAPGVWSVYVGAWEEGTRWPYRVTISP
jgi:hypothetical protein